MTHSPWSWNATVSLRDAAATSAEHAPGWSHTVPGGEPSLDAGDHSHAGPVPEVTIHLPSFSVSNGPTKGTNVVLRVLGSSTMPPLRHGVYPYHPCYLAHI